MSLLGVVLAGGESRRFGSPKCLARLHGRPLWKVAEATLRGVTSQVVAIANDPEASRQMELETRPDLRPGLGPLAGIETALAWARERGLSGALVLACDMPWVTVEALARLVDRWDGVSVVAPASPGPWGFEPLCAVYPNGLLGPVVDALREGQRQVGRLVLAQRPALVDLGELGNARLRSVNVGGDLPPPTVAVVGNKKSGKTTLAVALMAELSRRGRHVMSAKHGHHFRFDVEGTDSWKHRHEGSARRVLLVGPDEFALMGSWSDEGEPDLDRLLSTHLTQAEIVVAEGFRRSSVPKIEIFRSEAQPEPILSPRDAKRSGAIAIVTDRPELDWSVPVFGPDEPDLARKLADLVEDRLL